MAPSLFVFGYGAEAITRSARSVRGESVRVRITSCIAVVRLDSTGSGYLLKVRRRGRAVRRLDTASMAARFGSASSIPQPTNGEQGDESAWRAPLADPPTGGSIVTSFAPLSLLVVAMVCVRIVYTNTFAHGAVIWNLVLAWTPFGLALLAARRAVVGISRPALAGIVALWLILLPNGPYTVTDLKYAGTSSRVPVLFDVVLFSAAAWTGLLLGFTSLFLMQGIARRLRGPRAGWTLAVCALTSSAFGIYLGQVQRWNSWDIVVRPAALVVGAAHGLGDPRALLMTLLLTAFLLAGYLSIYAFGTAAGSILDAGCRTLPSRSRERRARRVAGRSMSSKPRLLILITLAEPGGAQTSVSLLIPGLVDRFDVTLATHGSGPLSDAARASGVPVVQLVHVRRALHPFHDVLGVFELLRLCRRLRPDIVHTHSAKAGVLGRLAATLAGVPIRVYTVHGWSFEAYGGLSGRLYLWIERAMQRFTSSFICVDAAARQLGVAAGACHPARSTVIHNGVDVSSFAQGGSRNGVPRVISVGRFAFPKDFTTLVGALARIRADHRAALVGAGPMLPEVADILGRLNLSSRVALLGTRRDVPDLLASSDVFVLSSRSEGFPVSILEAMAAGLPVVAANVGGVAEAVVDGETGLLVPAGDAAALAEALERLLRDVELRRQLGARGRQRARRYFDVAPFQAAHLELYRSELARRGLAASRGERETSRVRAESGARQLSVAAGPGE